MISHDNMNLYSVFYRVARGTQIFGIYYNDFFKVTADPVFVMSVYTQLKE